MVCSGQTRPLETLRGGSKTKPPPFISYIFFCLLSLPVIYYHKKEIQNWQMGGPNYTFLTLMQI